MILQSKVMPTTTFAPDIIGGFSSPLLKLDEAVINIPHFEWLSYSVVDGSFTELYHYLKPSKIRIKGDLIVACKNGSGDLITGRIKIGKTNVFEESPINMSLRKAKNDTGEKKTYTDDEKLQLFREYWDEKHDVPPASEVYKEFAIGRFYATIQKSTHLQEAVISIQNGIK